MLHRGKLVSLTAGAVALTVLIATGFKAKDRLLKTWYLHQLESGGPEAQANAARELAGLRAADTVPAIVRAAVMATGDQAKTRLGAQRVRVPYARVEEPFEAAILKLNWDAVPGLINCLGEESAPSPWLTQMLESIYLSRCAHDREQSSGTQRTERPPREGQTWPVDLLSALRDDRNLEPTVRSAADKAVSAIVARLGG